jgi:hypothetical protein
LPVTCYRSSACQAHARKIGKSGARSTSARESRCSHVANRDISFLVCAPALETHPRIAVVAIRDVTPWFGPLRVTRRGLVPSPGIATRPCARPARLRAVRY